MFFVRVRFSPFAERVSRLAAQSWVEPALVDLVHRGIRVLSSWSSLSPFISVAGNGDNDDRFTSPGIPFPPKGISGAAHV